MVDYPSFTSTTTLGSYQDNPEARLKILSQKGVDLRKYNQEEGEILFSRNSKFKVIDIQIENNIKLYIMEEL